MGLISEPPTYNCHVCSASEILMKTRLGKRLAELPIKKAVSHAFMMGLIEAGDAYRFGRRLILCRECQEFYDSTAELLVDGLEKASV